MGRSRAVAVQLGVFVALLVMCGASVAQAKAPKRLALGQLDAISATWSVTVTDCPYCLGGGQVDTASGSLTSRHVQVDVRDSRGRPVDTYGHPLPAAGALSLVGGQPTIDPLPKCQGPDYFDSNGPPHFYSMNIRFARAGDQLQLSWILPSCDGQIDGTPAQATPAQASIPLSTLKRSRYSIHFVATVPFDVAPDPSQALEGPQPDWRGTLAYDATLTFAHRCTRQRNGTRFCV